MLGEEEEPTDVLIDTLLEAAFPGHQGKVVEASGLTPIQREVLVFLLA